MRATRAGQIALHAEQRAFEERDAASARRQEAEAARDQLSRTLYDADMELVQAAWEGGRLGEVIRLLDREKADNPELRGFEWNYWMRRYHQGARTFSLPELKRNPRRHRRRLQRRWLAARFELVGNIPTASTPGALINAWSTGRSGTRRGARRWPRSRSRKGRA